MSLVQIQLSEDQLINLQTSMYQIALNAVEKVKQDAKIDVRYMSKKDTCTYMDIAYLTLEKWIQEGLPTIKIGQKVYIDRHDLDKFLLAHKRLKDE